MNATFFGDQADSLNAPPVLLRVYALALQRDAKHFSQSLQIEAPNRAFSSLKMKRIEKRPNSFVEKRRRWQNKKGH